MYTYEDAPVEFNYATTFSSPFGMNIRLKCDLRLLFASLIEDSEAFEAKFLRYIGFRSLLYGRIHVKRQFNVYLIKENLLNHFLNAQCKKSLFCYRSKTFFQCQFIYNRFCRNFVTDKTEISF